MFNTVGVASPLPLHLDVARALKSELGVVEGCHFAETVGLAEDELFGDIILEVLR